MRFPALLALVLGCAPAHAPRVPSGGLSVAAEAASDEGPFRVAFATPKGALDERVPGEITIVFSRPMRALDASAPPLAAAVRRGEAAIPGQWRWFGTRTAVFRSS